MKKNLIQTTLALLALSTLIPAHAIDIYTWKEGQGSAYSDVPRSLKTDGVNKLNIRTRSVTPLNKPTEKPAELTVNPNETKEEALARQHQSLNEELANYNKKTIEENQKREQENKEANCKTAKFNLEMAQGARTENKESLLKRYNADIKRYCN